MLQLMFIRPAVTPEHICIRGDDITSEGPVAPIRLQILVAVIHPGAGLKLGDAVPLDEEEFGLASQHWACFSSEQTPDSVQM